MRFDGNGNERTNVDNVFELKSSNSTDDGNENGNWPSVDNWQKFILNVCIVWLIDNDNGGRLSIDNVCAIHTDFSCWRFWYTIVIVHCSFELGLLFTAQFHSDERLLLIKYNR